MMSKSINCNGQLLDLSQSRVMGIINLSPDSFFSGSISSNLDQLSEKIEEMLNHDVDIIDIGAASSRPGSKPLSTDQEWEILEPVLERIRDNYPDVLISVDTHHGEVARRCFDFDVNIINDISGFQENQEMLDVLSGTSMAYVLMHKQGSTVDMQHAPFYKNVCLEVLSYFKEKCKRLSDSNIKDVIIDPGFGFGKTISHNYELLRKLSLFGILELPILVGISRKSMIYKELGVTAEEALNGTSALHMLALQNGAKILRAHDVKQAKECIKLYDSYLNYSPS